MKRKVYEVPTMDVVEFKQQEQLLAGSPSATIDGYEDGEFNWNGAPEFTDLENDIFSWLKVTL